MTVPKPNQSPYVVKCAITFTQNNQAGVEQKRTDEVIFGLDRRGVKMPWYVLRNYLVPRYLKQTYGPEEVGWQRIYEIKILKLLNRETPDDISEIPLRVMTLEQLEAYCSKWELSVPVREFYSVEKAREMVALRIEDESGYKKHLQDYREGKKRSYPELDSIRQSNKDVLELIPASDFDNLDKKPISKPISPELALSPEKSKPKKSDVVIKKVAKTNEPNKPNEDIFNDI